MQVVKDNSLTINDQEFFQLDQLIGEVPTKYGLKFVQFFNMIRQKRDVEKQMQMKTPDVTPHVGEKAPDDAA
jgi:hypothetical protein